MARIVWRELNYLRILLLAGWGELQLFLAFQAFASGMSFRLATRLFAWQLGLLLFIVGATRKGPSFKTFFRDPPSAFCYYAIRSLAVVILALLIVGFSALSVSWINRDATNTGLRTLVFLHFLGLSMAVGLAWGVAEFLEGLFFKLAGRLRRQSRFHA
jgi:hypothetical protein